MSKKQIVVGALIIVPIILLTVLESVIFSNRVKKDELFIRNMLVQRDKIGERNLVGEESSAPTDEEINLSLAAINNLSFRSTLAFPERIPKRIADGTNKILEDILRVSDNLGNRKFTMLFTDYYGRGRFIDKKQKAVAGSFASGFVYVDISFFEISNDEAELAAIIAHEVGHIVLRHSYLSKRCRKRLAPPFYWPAFIYYYSRITYEGKESRRKTTEQEEADILAVQYCYKAGYDFRAYLKLIKQEGFLPERLKVVEEEIGEIEKSDPTFRGVLFKHLTKENFGKKF